MSDPVKDLAYARNAATLAFDLSAYEHVRLTFEAKEFGDEPHAPPPGPFADDVAFDGVAISADGVTHGNGVRADPQPMGGQFFG